MIAPTHAGAAIHHINDTLQVSVMMRARFGMGMNGNRASPQLAGPSAGMGNGGSAGHASSLGSVQIERTAGYHPYPVLTPVTCGLLRHDGSPRMTISKQDCDPRWQTKSFGRNTVCFSCPRQTLMLQFPPQYCF